jgi:hypothetical protein
LIFKIIRLKLIIYARTTGKWEDQWQSE